VLPTSFSTLTNLEILYAPNCSLVGHFPSLVLEMRELRFCTLPTTPGLWRLKKMKYLGLSMNYFTGNLVVDGFAAVSLKWIDLSDTKLTGAIPDFFGSLKNLTLLILSNNSFSGVLPPELGKHSPGLWWIWVNDNELTGSIPEGLCDGGQLEIFGASSNQLNGSIPPSLANCTTLQKLVLRSNQTGSSN
jgi:kinase